MTRKFPIGARVWAPGNRIFTEEQGSTLGVFRWRRHLFEGIVQEYVPMAYVVGVTHGDLFVQVILSGRTLLDDVQKDAGGQNVSDTDAADNSSIEETDEDEVDDSPLQPQTFSDGSLVYQWGLEHISRHYFGESKEFIEMFNFSKRNTFPTMPQQSAPGERTPAECLHEIMKRGPADFLIKHWQDAGIQGIHASNMHRSYSMLYTWIGCMLRLRTMPSGDRREAWGQPARTSEFFEPVHMNLGRFMSYRTWEKMYASAMGSRDEQDLWAAPAEFAKIIGEASRAFAYRAPGDLVLDETMAVTYMEDQQRDDYKAGQGQEDKAPPIDYMGGAKPHDGYWHYSLACKFFNRYPYCLGLEPRARPGPHVEEKAAKGLGSNGQAVLRMAQPYFHTGRTIFCDSAYAGVGLAVCLGRLGLRMVGCVSTCSTFYPLKELKRYTSTLPRGQHCSLVCRNFGVTVIAVGYSNIKPRLFISANIGTTGKGPKMAKKRWDPQKQEEYLKEFDVADLTWRYWARMNAVDCFDRIQQDIIGLWKHFRAGGFHRRMLMFYMSVILGNAYSAYCFEVRFQRIHETPSVAQFLDLLMDQCLKCAGGQDYR